MAGAPDAARSAALLATGGYPTHPSRPAKKKDLAACAAKSLILAEQKR